MTIRGRCFPCNSTQGVIHWPVMCSWHMASAGRLADHYHLFDRYDPLAVNIVVALTLWLLAAIAIGWGHTYYLQRPAK